MSTVHVKIEIDAPIEKVWDTVMDPSQLKDWVTIHRAVRHVSDPEAQDIPAVVAELEASIEDFQAAVRWATG